MTERMASLTKKRSTRNVEKIPIVVCEYHQEVIQFIHRFIARKKLPFKGMTMTLNIFTFIDILLVFLLLYVDKIGSKSIVLTYNYHYW